jgi:hypothetical protein
MKSSISARFCYKSGMMCYSHLTWHMSSNCITECYLTTNQVFAGLPYPAKRKQALLGSNLSGIAGVEKSRNDGTRSSGRVPTHHFDPCLRKPQATDELSFLSGYGSTLSIKKACQISAIVKVWHRYDTSYDRV